MRIECTSAHQRWSSSRPESSLSCGCCPVIVDGRGDVDVFNLPAAAINNTAAAALALRHAIARCPKVEDLEARLASNLVC